MSEELFDLSEKYEAMLQRGLDLSGEDQQFFIRGRVLDLQARFPRGWAPRRILDFGCGVGHTANFMGSLFPEADIVGLDTSESALTRAKNLCDSPRFSFAHIQTLPKTETFDLCYVNGVFHHIEPSKWLPALRDLHRAIAPGGYLALFENNPWNPGARWVMKRIPFDRDAVPLSSRTTGRLVREAGFKRVSTTRYLFYFPRMLSWFRFAEPWFAPLPLGAQYYVLAQK